MTGAEEDRGGALGEADGPLDVGMSVVELFVTGKLYKGLPLAWGEVGVGAGEEATGTAVTAEITAGTTGVTVVTGVAAGITSAATGGAVTVGAATVGTATTGTATGGLTGIGETTGLSADLATRVTEGKTIEASRREANEAGGVVVGNGEAGTRVTT